MRTTATVRACVALPLAIAAALLVAPPPADAADVTREIAKHGDWHVIVHGSRAPTTCYIGSRPMAVEAGGGTTARAAFWVSVWPKAGVRLQPSVRGSRPYRKDSAVTISIGSQRFNLFTADDKAFIEDAATESKLVDAMRRGNTMIVEGQSANGGKIRDRYSLAGVTKAVAALTKACS